MSNISFMDSLLNGVAVEWKALSELGELVRGSGLQKKDFTETGVPAIHYGQIYTYYGLSTSKTKSFVSPDLARQLRKVNQGDVVITNTSENLKDVGKALVYLGGQQAVTGGHATILRPGSCLLGKYFAYFTQTSEFAGEKRKYAKGAKVIDVSATDMAKIRIPIPCPDNPKKSLEMQSEIVRILDIFTELTAELTAELAARKKQYNYYRDHLLSFEGEKVEWKALGDIGEFIRGRRFTKADYVEEGIPVIHYGEIYTRYGVWADQAFSTVRDDMAGSLRYAEPGDVVMAGVGETVEDVGKAVAWLGTQTVAIHDDSYAFRHSMNPKYISYAMQTASFNSQKTKHVSSGKVKRILIEGIKKEVRIPVPYPEDYERSLAEQARIVAILDKFDTLTNSISGGLPREIELRQKQYEYYRDLLLGFPKPEEVAA
ncbi:MULTISPECIES: restriction endonuclease subunit S [Pseudomonas]|uniref:restriction endonuclease subunit S n=1 Tax=Pseudomonas TaxID=286 RepID=UPI001C656EC5|nr:MULTISPECIES: restriction endonuclease subunit S [unclassified Pseudomonas]MBW8130577.1 restriction endonuclease subunit S [Pseudomonas sp. LAP_36]MBW8139638.1 restriction endonuclease subunit S [Pseudomonas sp. PAMC 26818]